jgi:putative lipoprotein
MSAKLDLESGRPIALIAALALAASACGGGAPDSQIFRGLAVHGHEVRSFRPCGSDDALWAIDPQGVLWEVRDELVPSSEPYEEVFAVVAGRTGPAPTEGFGAEYPGRIDIDEVLYVAWEGFGCDTDLSGFDYRAYGNEPFWNVELSAAGLRLNRLGSESQAWPAVQEHTIENGVHFEAAEPPIELTLVRGPCRDSMSGAYFGTSARLVLGAEELRGCALPGSP